MIRFFLIRLSIIKIYFKAAVQTKNGKFPKDFATQILLQGNCTALQPLNVLKLYHQIYLQVSAYNISRNEFTDSIIKDSVSMQLKVYMVPCYLKYHTTKEVMITEFKEK